MQDQRQNSKLKLILSILLPIYIFALLSGDFWSRLMSNDKCYRYLGCNIGFFGYDALVHFLSGVIISISLVLILRNYESTVNVFRRKWVLALFIMGIEALIGVVWEIIEFTFDHIRMDIFHLNLISPNLLAQPSNSDTMGDLTFGLAGALLVLIILYLYGRWKKAHVAN